MRFEEICLLATDSLLKNLNGKTDLSFFLSLSFSLFLALSLFIYIYTSIKNICNGNICHVKSICNLQILA